MEGFLGTRIQDAREKKNLSSKEAKLIGVSLVLGLCTKTISEPHLWKH